MSFSQPKSLVKAWIQSSASFPWHPILFVACIVLAFWVRTAVSPSAAVRVFVIAVLATAVATGLAWALLRNRHVAGAMVLALWIVLYSRQLVVFGWTLVNRVQPWQAVVWLSLIVVAIAVVARIALRLGRRGPPGAGFTSIGNRMSLILVLVTIVLGSTSGFIPSSAAELLRQVPPAAASPNRAVHNEEPDIYVLMLDGYPRADVLKARLDYDNSDFMKELRDRGFSAAAASHSDYLFTQHSLPSLLEMAYLEQIPELQAVAEGHVPLHPTLREILNRNAVFTFLRGRGYAVIATDSGFEQYTLRGADRFLSGDQLNEFELQFLVSTFAGDVVASIAPDLASGSHRERVSSSFQMIRGLAAEPSAAPRMVFAHIPSPHQPAVFGPNGEARVVPISAGFYSDSSIELHQDPETFIRLYTDQLGHVNGLVLDTIDGILKASPEPPIIIVMSDHGTASRVNWLATGVDEADPAAVLERTGTLFAAYTPGKRAIFPDDVSPVNVFRYLLDAYHGTAYGEAVLPPHGGHVPPIDASALSADGG